MRRTWAAIASCVLSGALAAACAPAEAERTRAPAASVEGALSTQAAGEILKASLTGPIMVFPASPAGFGDYRGPMLYPARVTGVRFTDQVGASAAFYGGVLALPEIAPAEGDLMISRPPDAAGERRYFGAANGHFALRSLSTRVNAAGEGEAIGWGVRDIDQVAAALAARGVAAIRFPGAAHRPNGVWTAPNGDQVLWFADPDGYPLAVVQQKPFRG